MAIIEWIVIYLFHVKHEENCYENIRWFVKKYIYYVVKLKYILKINGLLLTVMICKKINKFNYIYK